MEAEVDTDCPIPIAANGETASSVDHNHLNDAPVSEISDVESAAAAPKSGVDKEQEHDKHRNPNGPLFQLANLETRILQLEQEKESRDQEMASLEMKTACLQSEKNSWLQKEVGLLEKISQLQNENSTLGSKVTILEERIKQLDGQRESWPLKEANIEETVKNLHREREGWLQKEVNIGETVKNLYREREDWLQKEVSLEDKIMHMGAEISTWAAKEVTALEEFRENLTQENQKLMASLSEMQSQIQTPEKSTRVYSSNESQKGAENEELYSQIEAASALVEKLITENADLVEKVNELYVELEQRTAKAQSSSTVGSDLTIKNVEGSSTVDSVSETREKSMHHVALKTARSKEETIGNNISIDSTTVVAPLPVEKMENSSEYLENAEIIKIPLHENEIQEVDSQTTDNEETEVSFTEAPLIGAPFRLISFVAKYVSGADLVNKNASDLGH
ncbi:hypothetical protein RJ641_024454 [Dillenia turbinata]|uniref:Uncharacterized protein n=1 Tax=Dillenia turbinata TaxID=194707 RepID=A0AAN8ZMY5_9MAGN